MAITPSATQETTAGADARAADVIASAPARGHVGRIVAGSLIGGFAVAVFLVAGPLAGRGEAVVTGAVLMAFGAAWFMLALLSQRWTDQPQRWAYVPAVFTTVAGLIVLVF